MRYKITFSYDGLQYSGLQLQRNSITVAKVLNDALTTVFGGGISITPSGRTDSGVSAICQVAHFDYNGDMPKGAVGYVNHLLPASVRVESIEYAPNFHARYDAKTKTYKYAFYISDNDNAYYNKFACRVYGLDIDKVSKSLKYLVGTHDFTAFCASGTDVKDKVRTIYDAHIDCLGDLYIFSITGNGFLYNMVRIIIGTLFMIGTTDLPASHIRYVLNTKDRTKAGKTAPAYPLVLYKVNYTD